MTDDTAPHQNGVADDLAALAAPPAPAATPPAPTEPAPAPAPDLSVSAEGDAASPEATPAAPETPEAPAEPPPPSFDDLGLHPDVKLALDEMGYMLPTPVQTAVYRPVSEGKDLLVQSRTGTGKTTAFGLPTISKIIPTHRAPQALILAPTRELALQVSRELTQLAKHRGILVEPIYGGAPIGKQIHALRDGVHIVVGTPGRVLASHRPPARSTAARCRPSSSTSATRCCRWASSRTSSASSRTCRTAGRPCCSRRRCPTRSCATRAATCGRPEQISLSRDGISVNEIHHAYYIVSGIARGRDLLKIHLRGEPGERDHLLQHARRDHDGREVPAEAGPRRRAAVERPRAERSRARE